MTIHARLKAAVVIGILAVTTFVAAQSKDAFVGSWTLNAEKSKFISGPPLKSGTTIIEAAGSGYKWTVNQVPVTGAAQNWSFTTNLDGKPSKLTGKNPPADMVTVKRVDAMTLEVVSTINGKETTRQRIVVASRWQDAHDDHNRSGRGRAEDQHRRCLREEVSVFALRCSVRFT